MCKQYFYMRISTQSRENEEKQKEQSFDRQKGIFERAGYILTEENTFAERISGKTRADEREQFEKMLSVIEEGDWCIFTESSRFSRSYISGMEMLDTLIFDKKVNVKFVSNGIELMANGKYNPYTWYTISQMLLADELQRRIISFNTANGLKRKREMGVVLGTPRTFDDDIRHQVIAHYNSGHTMQECAEKFGVSTSSVHRFVNESKKESK